MQKIHTVLDTLNINSIFLIKISNIATISIAQTYKQKIFRARDMKKYPKVAQSF